MTARHIEARIVKLETSRRTSDDMLLIWRDPSQDTHTVLLAAKSAGLFASGDRVLCAEWSGDGEKPAPRWICRIKSDVTESEMDSLIRTAEKLAAGEVRSNDERSFDHYSDEQLWFGILGVKT